MNVNSVISAKFIVYKHTSPNGKVYIGITCQNPESRWRNGKGYQNNAHFWSAILKYGWDNFKHEIVAEGLSMQVACDLETKLIAVYNSMDPNFGYNQTTGGQCSFPSIGVRQRISEGVRNSRQNSDVIDRISNSLRGHVVSEETKQKISQANKGRKLGHPSPLKGRKLSEERRLKLCGKTPWNKGKTKHDDDRVASYANKIAGRVHTEHAKQLQREAWRVKYDAGYSPIWVNNGKSETIIDKSKLGQYIADGYTTGRLCVKNIYIYKDAVCKKISNDEMDAYLSDGWHLGRGDKINQKIKLSNQKYVWLYDNIEFCSAVDLAKYLNHNGYPNIVPCTITHLYKTNSFSKSKNYCNLDGKIIRKDVVK